MWTDIENLSAQGTTIDWKDAKKALTKLHPRPNMEDIEKQMEDGHNDSITINYGSFFHYFEEKDDEFDVCLSGFSNTSC